MTQTSNPVVLLVCADEAQAARMLARLFDSGVSAIGPAPTAGHALALAAQTSPTLAVVARPPTGRRSADELAEELMKTWGIRTLVLAEAGSEAETPDWAAHPEQVGALGALLAGAASSGAAAAD